MTMQQMTHWWLYDSPSTSKRSPWLQTTLSELEHKTEAMPVEELYRIHRSLAERYDQVKPDSGTRLPTTIGFPFSSTKCYSGKWTSVVDLSFDSHSETCDEPERNIPSLKLMILNRRMNPELMKKKKEDALSRVSEEEVRKLRETVARFEEENRTQKDELQQKDEVKREVIRQLSLAVDMLKEKNVELRKKCFARESPNNSSPLSNFSWYSCCTLDVVVYMFAVSIICSTRFR